jgi:hypothetical protein
LIITDYDTVAPNEDIRYHCPPPPSANINVAVSPIASKAIDVNPALLVGVIVVVPELVMSRQYICNICPCTPSSNVTAIVPFRVTYDLLPPVGLKVPAAVIALSVVVVIIRSSNVESPCIVNGCSKKEFPIVLTVVLNCAFMYVLPRIVT